MTFGEFDDFFDFRFGPFQMSGFSRPFKVGYYFLAHLKLGIPELLTATLSS
ncbi:MAG: hypothetical protein JRI92_13010 [Deltaproteobacteria bacterium]|nr:hypothetical protein [Deltaproteobacteria bacterium]